MKSPWGMEIALNKTGSIYTLTRSLDFSVFWAGFTASWHSACGSKDSHQQPNLTCYQLRTYS